VWQLGEALAFASAAAIHHHQLKQSVMNALQSTTTAFENQKCVLVVFLSV